MAKSSSGEARPWTIEDLYHRKAYLRAVPILILEKWEEQGGAPDTIVMSTEEIQDKLVGRGLLKQRFPGKGRSCLVRSLQLKEKQRKLKPAIVVEQVDQGAYRFNVGYHASLLRSFRERHPITGMYVPASALTEQPIPVGEDLNVQSQPFANDVLRAAQKYEGLWQQRLQNAENRIRELEQENRKLSRALDDAKGSRLVELREILTTRCNEADLRGLCFALGVDYEDLPGGGKAVKTIELIKYFERRGRTQDLLDAVGKLRPDIQRELWAGKF